MSKVITQPLIEALSDLVAQVSTIIVQKKGANQPPPPELPVCVMGIQKAAGTLVQVARSLAHDEYEDFPTIQEEISAGARDVETSAAQLNEATKVLITGKADDRAGAWDSLGDAVRVMAQNTAILLHIVYGAEIKKIFAQSSYAEGKLRDLLSGVQRSPVGLFEQNPQAFVNKVQAAMEDVQKLAQGVQQKATEEESVYAQKELEEAASQLMSKVEPFVAHANELLAKPKDAKAKEAVVNDLRDLITAAERVGAPKPKRMAVSQCVPELMEVIAKMQEVDLATPAGQKEAQRLRTVLHDVARASKLSDMGPHTALLNQLVEVQKDLDQIESALRNPDAAPLLSSDPFELADNDSQMLLNLMRKLSPDDKGGKESLMSDAEQLTAIVHGEILPLARTARADEAAKQRALAKVEEAKQALEHVVAGMGLSADQAAQVHAAERVNAACIKVNALAGSKSHLKTDVFSAAKDLTDMLSEMSALLALTGGGGAGGAPASIEGPAGALQAQLSVSEALVTPSQPKPRPRPGSAHAAAAKAAPPAVQYKTPAQKGLVSSTSGGQRDSVQSGFLSVGVGAEELRTISVGSVKGANLLPDTDPIITGVRSLGDQLAALSRAATSGDNAALLAAGRAIHDQMKAYITELRKRADACKDPRVAHELITLANQLKNWSVQLKILASVKASSGGGRDSDHALVNMARLVQNGLKDAPKTVLKGLLA